MNSKPSVVWVPGLMCDRTVWAPIWPAFEPFFVNSVADHRQAGQAEVDKRMGLVALARRQGVRAMALEWVKAWQTRSVEIAVLLIGLVVLTAGLVMQKRLSATTRHLKVWRSLYLLFTLGFIGWYAQGQLTIVNITAALDELRHGGDLGFFMNDPMTVILWIFVAGTLLVWGRGTFCGWLCPFGALQELISMLTQAIGIRQKRLHTALDAKLKWIKYGVLTVLVASVWLAPSFAEVAVEVEPFKTAISLYFVRDWPYIVWAVLCLGLSVFVYRGYCRYICPLGAALAAV